MTLAKNLLHMRQINKTFKADGNSISALKNINLKVNQGDYLSIQGPSGGGKSTLLSLLGLLDQATSGDYFISGVAVNQLNPSQMAAVRNREIGFIFQDFNLIGDLTVAQNVELPLIYRGMQRAERRDRVNDALNQVNMSSRNNHLPTQLSGGQQQRVAIARALVGSPSLLLADEPTGNLDSVNGDSVMQLLSELNQQGVTICLVTHDSRYADFAKRIVHLFDGEIIESEVTGTVSEGTNMASEPPLPISQENQLKRGFNPTSVESV